MNLLAEMPEGVGVLAAMATPTALLLADAMLILSTNQRLQAILERVRETEIKIAGADAVPQTLDLSLLNDLLVGHAKRARFAHRALLSFYGSAGLFALLIVALGGAGLGGRGLILISVISAFAGCTLLFTLTILLMTETWIGIKATDRRFASIMDACRQLRRRVTPD